MIGFSLRKNPGTTRTKIARVTKVLCSFVNFSRTNSPLTPLATPGNRPKIFLHMAGHLSVSVLYSEPIPTYLGGGEVGVNFKLL